MKLIARNALILGLGLVLGISLSIGSSVFAERSEGEVASPLPLDELRSLSEIFGKIKADYVEEVDDKTLLKNAIKGMLSGLDPHSSYLDKDDFKDLQIGTRGEFGGLGIQVSMEDGFVKVISPIDDTPAQKAGVQAGDLIVRLDDTPVKGMTLDEAVKIMRGKPGSKITLTIAREGEASPIKIKIIRAVIKVKSVKQRILEPGFAYVRITSFQTRTGEQLREAVSKLRKESEGELKGLVLDLRNNPGGVLGAAISVSDAFLEKGLIVYTAGRSKESEERRNATPGDVLKGAPMIVLVNGGSASASEIVAGALQDQKRAVIMGSRTFGKGSVQTIFPMSNDSAVKLTTARYYTPLGRSIQAEGIDPDIEVAALKVEARKKVGEHSLREADLSRHLENGDKKEKDKNKDAKAEDTDAEEKSEEEEPLAVTDYALHEALTTLKAYSIFQSLEK